jgi:hypothetical protein
MMTKKPDQKTQKNEKKKLVLNKQSIQTLDRRELSMVVGGYEPPDGGCSRHKHTK